MVTTYQFVKSTFHAKVFARKNFCVKKKKGSPYKPMEVFKQIKSHGMTLQCTEYFRVFPCFSVAKSTRRFQTKSRSGITMRLYGTLYLAMLKNSLFTNGFIHKAINHH